MINIRYIWNKLFKKQLSPQEIAIVNTYHMAENTSVHLVAVARLLFITPETLVREVNNVKANADYILKMSEAQQKGKKV